MSQHDDEQRTKLATPRLRAWHPLYATNEKMVHWLIHRAAYSAPADLAERLEEEWLADLATRRSAPSRLGFALGCCWATRVIALEHVAAAPLATSPAGEKRWGSALSLFHLASETRFASRRSIAFLVVVCLHVAVFYALLSGLAVRFIRTIPATMQTRLIEVPHPREVVPPLLPVRPPSLTADSLRLPLLELPQFAEDPEPQAVERSLVDRATPTLPEPPQLPPATTHAVNRTQGGPGNGFPNADDYYPMVARHLEEQGIGTVHVCVDTKGRLTSEPTTVVSTGSKRLDAGALQLAQAGYGHYRPTLQDGRPVDSCYDFRVRFELKN
jgi:protein TonB